ncbi:MAG TPA: (2Fe-2S)-binding protein [Alphaproteobacteria bacterium]|nr:(2Fe-2S)-binding protein [Alphaproteobacteria bacterium]
MAKQVLSVTVNGEPYELLVDSRTTLLQLLREHLGLTGTKEGCSEGECGACSVILNGRLVDSCLIFALEASGGQVETIEGLAAHGELHPVQKAFIECGGVQCGFCTPGMIMASKALLDHTPNPTEDQIRRALGGNLCRCTGYAKIIDAVQAAAGMLTAKSA